ncbi:unnamed protein product [Calicophoron daubneyi]|uniref:ER membrane protein complex subunit 10 n=1 Tax=Calicophoron daubneyi TaxID=300641 RepID=A0AAV2T064_CALDB
MSLLSSTAFTLLVIPYLCFADSLSFPVEHSLDDGHTFKPIGSLSSRLSSGVMSVNLEDTRIGEKDFQLLLNLVGRSGLYHVRIRLSESDYLESAVMACLLVGSEMKAKFMVSVNEDGFPIALHISTPRFECASVSSLPTSPADLPRISLNLEVQKPNKGASPETIKYLLKLEKQREEMARAEQGDNRSFFAKYWTYIVPAVILFVVFSSIQDASNSGGGSGGGSQ